MIRRNAGRQDCAIRYNPLVARVYLETSFFGVHAGSRTDAKSVYWRQVTREWWETRRQLHELLASTEVVAELSKEEFAERDDALALLRSVDVVDISDDAIGLGRLLVREQVMPGPLAGDAIHVAVAAVSGCEYLLSWNVKHLANPNKARHLTVICARAGYLSPRIVTPDTLF